MKFILSAVFLGFLILLGCKQTEQTCYFEIELNTNWKIKYEHDTAWYPVSIPDFGLNDLVLRGVIDTSFSDENIEMASKILNAKRTYAISFDVPVEILKQDSVFIQFDGIADKAEIYINNTYCGTTQNMFVGTNVPCKHLLKEFNNTLEIKSYDETGTLSNKVIVSNDNSGLNQQNCRKALFLKGSDINSALPFVGIWKPVKILAWSKAHISKCRFETLKVTEKEAVIEASIFIESVLEVEMQVLLELNRMRVGIFPIKLKIKNQENKFQFTVNNPQLWWCRGMGDPKLQTAEITLLYHSVPVSKKKVQFGIRKIELVQQNDSIGYNFFFKLNNKPVFIKGAAFVPLYNFSQNKVDETCQKVIDAAVNSNLNLLRVWGGGFYESDHFYDLCDRNGLLVWQDLPFSCNKLKDTEVIHFSIEKEITQNMCRIANHPSLALVFCNPDITTSAGFDDESIYYNKKSNKVHCTQFFTNELPGILNKNTSVPYYSKCMADTSVVASKSLVRDWRVWYGAAPFSDYYNIRGGFFTEFGFKSIPNSIAETNTENDTEESEFDPAKALSRNTFNETDNNQLILDYLQMYYNDAFNMNSTVYLSQVMQAEAVKSAVNAHAIHKPFCMGSILWHFNETTPGITWSVLDYYGNQKPAWYSLRSGFKQITVVPERNNDDIRIWIVNDSSGVFEGTCNVSLVNFTTNAVLYSKDFNTNILAQQSQIQWLVNEENFIMPNFSNKLLLYVTLRNKKNQVVDEEFLYFTDPKYLDLPIPDITYTLQPASNGYFIKFRTTSFAKNVVWTLNNSNAQFSDNNLDMLPGREYSIFVNFNGSEDYIEEHLKILSLVDSY